MWHVLLNMFLLSVVFSSCAKNSDGFAPSEKLPDAPSTSNPITSDDNMFMKIATKSDTSGWIISLSYTELVQAQTLANGWEVEVVQD